MNSWPSPVKVLALSLRRLALCRVRGRSWSLDIFLSESGSCALALLLCQPECRFCYLPPSLMPVLVIGMWVRARAESLEQCQTRTQLSWMPEGTLHLCPDHPSCAVAALPASPCTLHPLDLSRRLGQRGALCRLT